LDRHLALEEQSAKLGCSPRQAIGEPRRKPSTIVAISREKLRRWIEPLVVGGPVRLVHAKVGSGAIVVFSIDGNEALHEYLNQWSDNNPARFEIHAVIEPVAANEVPADQIGASK